MDTAALQHPQEGDRLRELTPEEMALYREFAEHGPLRSSQLYAREDRQCRAATLDALLDAGLVSSR
ncbi:hypothetical protein [Streptomyces sp. NPDC007369]|uniref:hypothetical protein n=1 Tax=Streptomyces sp. NPDC007369 TaxID=3154589 RepID=UPI0033D60D18